MNEQEIRKIVQDEINQNFRSGNPILPPHNHNGVDNFQIDPRNLLGFSIRTVTPTDAAPDGTLVLSDISGTRKIWVRINKVWYSVNVS